MCSELVGDQSTSDSDMNDSEHKYLSPEIVSTVSCNETSTYITNILLGHICSQSPNYATMIFISVILILEGSLGSV